MALLNCVTPWLKLTADLDQALLILSPHFLFSPSLRREAAATMWRRSQHIFCADLLVKRNTFYERLAAGHGRFFRALAKFQKMLVPADRPFSNYFCAV